MTVMIALDINLSALFFQRSAIACLQSTGNEISWRIKTPANARVLGEISELECRGFCRLFEAVQGCETGEHA